MRNLWLQSVYKFLLIHIVGLLIVLSAFIGVGIFTKKSQSDAITSGIKQNYLVGDFRSVVSVLNNALLFSFEHIEVRNSKDEKLFSVGGTGEKNNEFQVQSKTHIYLGNNNEKPYGEITFFYSLWPMLFYGSLTYLLIIFLSVPYLIYLKKKIKLQYDLELKKKQDDFRVSLAEQVTHDIRSPLTALNMVIDQYSDIPERDLAIIKSSTQRINDIANNLLANNKSNTSSEDDIKFKLKNEKVAPLIEAIITEKRMEYRHYPGLEIEIDLKNSQNSIVYINAYELSCVVSNLINNSIESFDTKEGNIKVIVQTHSENVEISIMDNGKGMPAEIVAQLGREGFSFGKEHLKHKGNGLGFFNAKKIVEGHFKGKVEIQSTPDVGTIISVFLNRVSEKIILLDDDKIVRTHWEKRAREESIDLLSLSTTSELWNKVSSFEKNTTFYIDMDLSEKENGLDVTKQLYEKGFTNLFLATGYEAHKFNHVTWIKGVVGKEFVLSR